MQPKPSAPPVREPRILKQAERRESNVKEAEQSEAGAAGWRRKHQQPISDEVSGSEQTMCDRSPQHQYANPRITPSRPQKGVIALSIQPFAEVRQYRFLCKSMNWIAACVPGRISWKVLSAENDLLLVYHPHVGVVSGFSLGRGVGGGRGGRRGRRVARRASRVW